MKSWWLLLFFHLYQYPVYNNTKVSYFWDVLTFLVPWFWSANFDMLVTWRKQWVIYAVFHNMIWSVLFLFQTSILSDAFSYFYLCTHRDQARNVGVNCQLNRKSLCTNSPQLPFSIKIVFRFILLRVVLIATLVLHNDRHW